MKQARSMRNSGFGHGAAQAGVGVAVSAATTLALVSIGVLAVRDAWAALVPALVFSAATVRQTAWWVQGYRHDALVHWNRSWLFFAVWTSVILATLALCFPHFDVRMASDRVLGCALMSGIGLLFLDPAAVLLDGEGRFVRRSWLFGSKRHPLRGDARRRV